MARVRKQPGTVEKLKQYCPPVVLNPQDYMGKWGTYFGNNQPIHVEVGMGKGRFIYNLALQNPHINYIGVELVEEVILVAVKRMKRQGEIPPNLALVWLNAQTLKEVFAEREVDRVYLNFSDPWPKYRHAKRRLTHHGFLANYQYMLREQGEVHFKTDNQGLFQFSLNEFSEYDWKLKNISLDLYKKEPEGNVATEYELKFSAQGMPIYRLEAISPNR